MKNIALIIAGGIGARMHVATPKQFINVFGKPIIIYTLEVFQNHPNIDAIEIVCLDGWVEILKTYVSKYNLTKVENIVVGGSTGQESIRNGLNDVSKRYNSDDDIVIIHDSVRPLITSEIISNNISICRLKGNATTVIPCTSVMLKTDDSIISDDLVPRDHLKITQTPQSFFLNELLSVHKEAKKIKLAPSIASCSLYIEMGKKIYLSAGSEKNIKITTTDDIDIMKAIISADKNNKL